MSDEFKLLKQRDLGARAKQLRENELLTQIFEGLRADYMREWAQTELLDTATREHRYLQLHALLDVRAQLNAIIVNGDAAAKFLEHAEQFKAA